MENKWLKIRRKQIQLLQYPVIYCSVVRVNICNMWMLIQRKKQAIAHQQIPNTGEIYGLLCLSCILGMHLSMTAHSWKKVCWIHTLCSA